jgi:hypothetical protein
MAMTEEEWLECSDPKMMLRLLRGKASDRKLRLFACSCCRHIWHVFADRRCREAVEVGELFADGLVSDGARNKTFRAACRARGIDGGPNPKRHDAKTPAYYAASFAPAAHAITAALNCSGYSVQHLGWKKSKKPTRGLAVQERLLRDIFGNPFRPVTLNRAWRTSNVTALAQAIYDDRAFDRLPILADALEDAGCDNADILNHCRQSGVHVRGCWCVDRLLEKS